ncbi:MAG: hypothetical protein AB1805_13705 [Nitrospirota bacterium]
MVKNMTAGELFSSNQGAVRLVGAEIAKSYRGDLYAMNDTAVIEICSAEGCILESHPVVRGSKLFIDHDLSVDKGQRLAQWYPFIPVFSEARGRVAYGDIIDGETVVVDRDKLPEVEHRMVISVRNARPRIEIRDARGETVTLAESRPARYPLPVGAFLIAENGEHVRPGDLLALLPRSAG